MTELKKTEDVSARRLDPWENFEKMFRDFFERPGFGRPEAWPRLMKQREEFSPQINVTENEDALQVSVELPGLKQEDVEISLDHDVLSIRGTKRVDHEEENDRLHWVERRYGSFERRMSVPFQVDPDQVEATMRDGVLMVKLPKTEAAKASSWKVPIRQD